MSVSFNNRPHVNVEQFSLGNKSVAPAKSTGNSNVQSSGIVTSQAGVRDEKLPVLNNQVMVPGAAFTKLFDMLEQIFSAMREMFMGPKTAPVIVPESNKSVVTPDAHQHSGKPDANKLEVKLQPSVPVPAKSESPIQNLKVGLSQGPKPEIIVTHDAKSNMHVNVSVGHCHCPESADSDAKSKMRLDNKARIQVGPDVNAEDKVEVKAEVTPGVTPDTKPQPMPTVIPDATPKPSPDVPDQELTSPAPAEVQLNSRNWRLNVRNSYRS
ncbi:hypothetical protein BFW88_18375 [Pseudomonas fluorescens]|uniref:Uncharacterized protein n=1 Tax=Pseudomonas lactucae TaxID=2813360 RepID=A0A9X0YA66_9PSED|nr:hypothetical protein [Pseudomonas lactucae]OPA87963.1 hypothetical protein BFW88_18375 [Pseudomonas fluorescens]MBN2975841.1 hypothetical protein [Pseudomonas lactucae]MBN2988903.1 hypothetical protein [Pseudomonas lactucae]OPB08027.1 hypothetical protein BFW92_18315 [Pseudomonas fluorescens]OPB18801.1 hypothetical protein BFW93_18335 [Pseudomonas fluorescens]